MAQMTLSIAFTTSWQLYFLMSVGRRSGTALFHDRPRTIQQPYTIQCSGSSDQDNKDNNHLFHEPALYTNDVQGA